MKIRSYNYNMPGLKSESGASQQQSEIIYA